MQNSNNSCDYLSRIISDLRNMSAFLNELQLSTADSKEERRIGIAHSVIAEQLRHYNKQKDLIREEECKLRFQNERIYKNLVGI